MPIRWSAVLALPAAAAAAVETWPPPLPLPVASGVEIPDGWPATWEALPGGVPEASEADSAGTGATDRSASAPRPSARGSSEGRSALVVAGSKEIRVGVGEGGGTSVEQTLDLTARGEIAPGISLEARLSDEDLPMSSQGGSAALREVDQVRVRAWGRQGELVAGDQDWTLDAGLGAAASRRLRGIALEGRTDSDTLRGTTGSLHARWMRATIAAQEGQQEGYVLPGPDGSSVPVVPGSERIQLDGETLVRGKDYEVRWAEGLLDLATTRRITAASHLEAEYQAADLDYRRDLRAGEAGGRHGAWSWRAWGVSEADDPTSPLSFEADSTADSTLRLAGADSTAAVDSAGDLVPLPRSLGAGGATLSWDGGRGLRTAAELRGSVLDRNEASSLDARRRGLRGAAEASLETGRFLSEGGSGRWKFTARSRGTSSGYRDPGGLDSLGSGADPAWNRPADAEGETTERRAETGLSWKPAPAFGSALDLGWRDGDTTRALRAGASLGRDDDARRLLLEGAWARWEQEGRPDADRWWGRLRARRAARPLSPYATLEAEDRIWSAVAPTHRRWAAATAGSEASLLQGLWTGKLEASARLDRSDLGSGGDPSDSARSLGGLGSLAWNAPASHLEFSLDGRRVETRTEDGWSPATSWLGSAKGSSDPVPGLSLEGAWKLTTTSYRPLVQLWDTVATGAGTYKWDSLLGEIVQADDGDLVPAGSAIDTSVAAVAAAQRELSGELELEPGRLLGVRDGWLADLGMRLEGSWSQSDSSGEARLVPAFLDREVNASLEASSSLSAEAWWKPEGHEARLAASRSLEAWAASDAALRPSRERALDASFSWTRRWDSAVVSLRTVVGQEDRIRLSSSQERRAETARSLEVSVSRTWLRRFETTPSAKVVKGFGEADSTALSAASFSPALSLRLRLPAGGEWHGEGRWAVARNPEESASRLSGWWVDGRTWRFSSGVSWKIGRKLFVRADWVLRLEPASDPFQKLTAEGRAEF